MHHPGRRSLASSLVAAIVLLVGRTAAAAPGFELDWQAPPQCPDATDAHGRVAGLVADAPDDATTRFVHAEVRITEGDTGYRMTLRTEAAGAVRELAGDDCDELATTAALIVAIAIDPRVLARIDVHTPTAAVPPPPIVEVPPPAVATTDATSPPPPAAVIDDERPAPAPTRPERRPPRLVGRVVAGLDIGTLPSPTADFAASIGLAWPRARVEIESDYAVRRPVRSRSNDAVGVQAQAWSAGVRGCYVLARGRLELPLCAIARGGLLHARGDGELTPRTAFQPRIGVGPGIMLLVALAPRIALAFGLDAMVATLSGGFRTEPSGTIGGPWPVSLHAWAGVQWRRVTGPRGGGQPRR